MAILSNQFQTIALLSSLDDKDLTLEQCARLDFKTLVPQHLSLTLEYTILRGYLQKQLQQKNTLEAELIDQLITARKIAMFLAFLYKHYLSVSREVFQHQNDEIFYRTILNQQQILPLQLLNPWQQEGIIPDKFTQKLRSLHALCNWTRLLIVRCKRVLVTFSPVADTLPFSAYSPAIEDLDHFSSPTFAYLSWVFFAPRLLVNLLISLKHMIPHPWMTPEEKSLGFSIRSRASFKRRWFEMGNDSIWLISGALNCFALLGSLLPVALYLTAALYLYDVVLAALRAYIELDRFNRIKQDYLTQTTPPPPALIAQLEQHRAYEKRRLFINIATTIGLCIAIGLSLPVLLSVPYLPLIAAILLVLFTIASFIASKINEKTKPPTQLGSVTQYGFFASPQQHTANPTPRAATPIPPAADPAPQQDATQTQEPSTVMTFVTPSYPAL